MEDYAPLRTTLPPKYFKLLPDFTNPGNSLMISCPDCLFQCSWRCFFFSPSVLTTSLLWSPHPVIHLPHFVALICWAPNSNQDTFLPECPHALDDCLKGLNPTWFQPVFPASFSRRLFPLWHYSSWRFWASPMDAMHFYATSCSSFSSCSAPLTFHDPNHAFLHLLPSSGSIDSQSLPLLCFHSTPWICEFVFIVMV